MKQNARLAAYSVRALLAAVSLTVTLHPQVSRADAATELASSAVPGTTIWSFLGVDEFKQQVKCMFQLPAFKTLTSTFISPMTAAVGLNPHVPAVPPMGMSPLAGPGADGPGGPVGTAAAIAAQQKTTGEKVAAIRYLATVDCLRYPEVVHSLLISLDDCAEEVRYEALLALRKCCGTSCQACCDPRLTSTCPNCQCQTVVIARLSDLLLARDVNNGYLERSERVRQLASAMISECLKCRPAECLGTPDFDNPAKPDPSDTTFAPPIVEVAPLIPMNPEPAPWNKPPVEHSKPIASQQHVSLVSYQEPYKQATKSIPPKLPPAQRIHPVVEYTPEHSEVQNQPPARLVSSQVGDPEPLPPPNSPEVVPSPSGVQEPIIIIDEGFPMMQGGQEFMFGEILPPIYDEQPLDYVGPKPIPNDVVQHAIKALDAECTRTRCSYVPTIGIERVPFALFEIESARPQNALSTRFDYASGINRPDRAEYYWSQIGSGGPASPETNLDYLELKTRSETMIGNSSGFFEIPLRFLDPTVNNNTTSFTNLTFGTKSVLIEENGMFGLPTPGNNLDKFQVSSLFKTHISLGSPLTGRGLTRGYVSLQPGALVNYMASPTTYFHGEASYWIPLGGSGFSGNFFQCGFGVSHVLSSSLLAACPSDSFAIIPTLEVVGTKFTTGMETLPDGTTQAADNSPIINVQPGVRIVVGNHMEIGGSYARNITHDRLFKDLGRFEVRWFW
ncbi:Uncharacterized protein SCF082_LOCUS41063 [Durusdinium trenchii]|uniref:HEAT repeat domain-containing protein n=1 Tax=Durusdinium trenchii TaxID=1381693 RepID=A0ABP0PZ33_9DINO